MPGLTVVAGPEAETALRSLLPALPFRGEVLLPGDNLAVGVAAWPGYPVRVVRTPEGALVVEGRFYAGAPDPGDLAVAMLAGDAARVGDLLDGADADVLLVAVGADGRFAVANDALARLPTYVGTREGRIVVSRDISAHAHPGAALDRVAMAEQLVYGYALAERTHLADVRRLAPGSLFHAGGGRAETRTWARWDFSPADPAPTLPEMVDLFTEACRVRGEGADPLVVSLSGGLDSRCVGAALARAGVPFRASTLLDPAGTTAADFALAERLAGIYGAPWDPVRIREHTPEDVARLLHLKLGHNYLGMGFVVPYLEHVAATYGHRAVVLTGDGGGNILPDCRAPSHLGTPAELADYILARHHIFPVEEAATFAGVPPRTIRDALVERLAGYPEPTMADRHVHFLLRDRATNFIFEGEDRNRCYYWDACPYFAAPFLRRVMQVPGEEKSGHGLFHRFTRALSPEAARVPDATFRAPLGSLRLSATLRLVGFLHDRPRLEQVVKRIRGWPSHEPGSPWAAAVRGHLAGGAAAWLDRAAVERVLADPKRWTWRQQEFLRTATAVAAAVAPAPGARPAEAAPA